MMNILFLSTIIPYPPVDGHSQRTYHLLTYLARHHRIHLIGFIKKPGDWASVEVLRSFCAEVYPFSLPEDRSRLALGFSLLGNFFSPHPFVVQKYFSPKVQAVIKHIMQRESIDLIHCDMPNLTAYAPNGEGPPSLAVHHDLEWLLMDRRAHFEFNPLKKVFFSWQAQKWKNFVYELETRVKAQIVVSSLDQQRLKRISRGKLPIRIIPNGVDIDFFHPQTDVPSEKLVLLLGGLHLFQNADGVRYFLKDIWPTIQEMEKGIRCLIIGQNPYQRLARLAADKGAEMLGFVPDIRPFMAKAGVMVVPIRIGSGTRLKILSAMAMGKAVVSTSIGCEGIEAASGHELLIADTPQDMAHHVVQILRNPDLQKHLGKNARKLVEEKYSWTRIAHLMEKVYQELAHSHPLTGEP